MPFVPAEVGRNSNAVAETRSVPLSSVFFAKPWKVLIAKAPFKDGTRKSLTKIETLRQTDGPVKPAFASDKVRQTLLRP
jgi:hypothetical protein